MKHLITCCWLGIWLASTATGQVTYSEHIAPIIYDNCTSCHRQGEIGPFPLTNYFEALSWSNMIKYTTQIKYMPPWQPDPAYSHFVGESNLTDAEIQLIADWVDAGSPQGDPSLAPPVPSYPSGSQLGTPDLVLTMSEDYFIEGNNQDDYRVFVLPTGLTADKEIAAIEFRPGNTQAVHHALLAFDTQGAAAQKDSTSPGYGYESFGSFGVATQGTFTGYTPGIQPLFFPEGIGTTLPAGADLLIQVHYAPLPNDETDRSSLNVFFKKPTDPIVREVERMRITPFDLPGGFLSFSIPADQQITFHGTKTVTEDISLISVYPHCHYLGKYWEMYAVDPNNDTINIIRINEWDFNWQGAYTLDRMKKIPENSVIHIIASYDNTANNPFNPNNPPQQVRWGEGTADEMYLVGTTYVPYMPGDEDIVMSGNTSTSIMPVASQAVSRLSFPFPNPASDAVLLNYYLDQSQSISIELYDGQGRKVQEILPPRLHAAGDHQVEFQVGEYPAGVYAIRMRDQAGILASRLLIVSE